VASLVEQRGSLAAQIDSIPNYILTPDVRVPYKGNDREAILERAAQKLAQYQPNRIDGVRIDFADGWAMIRSSVTEPLFTLRFEAKTTNRLGEIIKILLSALPQELQKDITAAMPSELR
jgi:phosphomannomutase/phosphoglucomutase